MVGFIHYIHTTVVQCCPDGVTAASMIQALAAGSLCDLSDCLTDQTQRESEQLCSLKTNMNPLRSHFPHRYEHHCPQTANDQVEHLDLFSFIVFFLMNLCNNLRMFQVIFIQETQTCKGVITAL